MWTMENRGRYDRSMLVVRKLRENRRYSQIACWMISGGKR